MSTSPIHYNIGQRVKVTKENWLTMRNGNRSIMHHPSDSFTNDIYSRMKTEEEGTVTWAYLPGYEVNVQFHSDGRVFQMKDSWITPVGKIV